MIFKIKSIEEIHLDTPEPRCSEIKKKYCINNFHTYITNTSSDDQVKTGQMADSAALLFQPLLCTLLCIENKFFLKLPLPDPTNCNGAMEVQYSNTLKRQIAKLNEVKGTEQETTGTYCSWQMLS